MGTGKNWKIENGEYLFLLDTLFIMRILIFPNCYKKKNVQLKKLAKFLKINKFSMNCLGGTTSCASVNQNSKDQQEEKDPFLLGNCATFFP